MKITCLQYTTLNEKFNVGSIVKGRPILNAITIGIRPVDYFEDNEWNLLDYKRSAITGALLEHTPFIVRNVEDD